MGRTAYPVPSRHRRYPFQIGVRVSAAAEVGSMDLYILKTWLQAKFNTDSERGASMVEYGLLLALIAVIAIVAVKALGTSVSTKFSSVNSSIQ
jgi:pilus assembly protein Flp/PilA